MDSIGILHLSDLHFKREDSAESLLGPLREDLGTLNAHPRFIVVSGDFIDKGQTKGFPVAVNFLRGLQQLTQVPWEHFILCPGNHDLERNAKGIFKLSKTKPANDDLIAETTKAGYIVRDPNRYAERFRALHEALSQLPGHTPKADFHQVHFFPGHGLQFLTTNTSARIDEYRDQAGIDDAAFSKLLSEADEQIATHKVPVLRIAVWHHAIEGNWCINANPYLDRLRNAGFALLLHGDVHEERLGIANAFQNALTYLGCGALNAEGRAPSTGYFYHYLQISHDLREIKVQVRERKEKHGAFDGYFKFGPNGARISDVTIPLTTWAAASHVARRETAGNAIPAVPSPSHNSVETLVQPGNSETCRHGGSSPVGGNDGLHARVRLVLYSKSDDQLEHNRKDAGNLTLQPFTKPHSHFVFSNIKQYGVPDATVVSLDEDWIRPLVADNRLCDLSHVLADYQFLPILEDSVQAGGRKWAAPHFLDFSYYSVNRRHLEAGTRCLNNLRSDDAKDTIEGLRKSVGTERLLLYDFHVPNACACVVLEIIKGLGAGVGSLSRPLGLSDPANIRALKTLRLLVGDRDPADFRQDYHLDLDRESANSLLVREWHSRMADLPKTQAGFQPFRKGIPGTLGGWHIGVLANPPSPREVSAALHQLLNLSAQKSRFLAKAGAPTLNQFYEDPEFSGASDPVTSWSLVEIRDYLKDCVQRSVIPNYRSVVRDRLLSLHNEIMKNPPNCTEEIVRDADARQLSGANS